MRTRRKKHVSSRTRLRNRSAEKVMLPAIKALAENVHATTSEIPPIFDGYKLNAGNGRDGYGRDWQYQLIAVCRKNKMMKKDELITLYNKNPWKVKLRTWIKTKIDGIFSLSE